MRRGWRSGAAQAGRSNHELSSIPGLQAQRRGVAGGGAGALGGSLVKGQQQGTLEARLAQYSKPKLLIIDELGYLPLEPQAGHLFFQLISRRYEQGSVLISSNRPVEEWDEVFGDQVVAAAILDRLMHHSHVVTIRGDSYRLREKRRAGLRGNCLQHRQRTTTNATHHGTHEQQETPPP